MNIKENNTINTFNFSDIKEGDVFKINGDNDYYLKIKAVSFHNPITVTSPIIDIPNFNPIWTCSNKSELTNIATANAGNSDIDSNIIESLSTSGYYCYNNAYYYGSYVYNAVNLSTNTIAFVSDWMQVNKVKAVLNIERPFMN